MRSCHSFDWIIDMIDLVAPDLPEPEPLPVATPSPSPPVVPSPPPSDIDRRLTQIFVNFYSSRILYTPRKGSGSGGGGGASMLLGLGCLMFSCNIIKGVKDQTYTILTRDVDLQLSKKGRCARGASLHHCDTFWGLTLTAVPVCRTGTSWLLCHFLIFAFFRVVQSRFETPTSRRRCCTRSYLCPYEPSQ